MFARWPECSGACEASFGNPRRGMVRDRGIKGDRHMKTMTHLRAGAARRRRSAARAAGSCPERSWRHRHHDQDRQHRALFRAGIRLRADRRNARQGTSRRSTPTAACAGGRLSSSPTTTPTRRPRRWSRPRKLVESDQVLATVYQLGTPTNSAIHRYMNQKASAAPPSGDRCHEMGRPGELPLHAGLQPVLPDGRPDLRQVHPRQHARCQDRRALPERRLRQGLPARPARRAWATRPTP